MSQSDVDAAIAQRTSLLATKAYIDQQDGTAVTKSYVDTQDALYLNSSIVSQANGAMPLNSAGKMNNAHAAVKDTVPRGPRVWNKTTGWTDSGLTSTQTRLLGSFFLPDPGYKYFPVITGGGFEQAMSASGTDCRVDIAVRINSTTGSGVAYGTGKLGDSYSRCPVSIVPDLAAGSSLTGGLNYYVTVTRGFGSGSFYLYTANAYVTIIMLPIY